MKKPPYIVKVKRLWGKHRGFTFYPFIFMMDIEDESLLRHEKVHIQQQLDGWLIGFYIKYIYYHFRYGYENNPYEIEAYKNQ